MRVQRLQNNNYMQQFNGILKVTKNGCNIAQGQISQEADKKLYKVFVKLLGEEPRKFASFSGGTSTNVGFNDYVKCVNELLNTKIWINQKNPPPYLFYSYTSDGNANLCYQIRFLSSPYSFEHSLNRGEKYLLAKNKK